jgi:hypothetical protein
MEIRSYRAVFDLERRIYRVDRLRLNPAGVPVRGVVYALALIAAALICGSVPPIAAVAHALPWYLINLALPIGGAALLTVVAIDGRPAHLAAHALLRHRLEPRRRVGLRPAHALPHGAPGCRWWPPEILILPDGSDARLRRLRYTGPGAALVTVAHVCAGRPRRGAFLGLRIGRPPLARLAWARRPQVTLRERPGTGPLHVGQAGGGEPGAARVIALAPDATLSVE